MRVRVLGRVGRLFCHLWRRPTLSPAPYVGASRPPEHAVRRRSGRDRGLWHSDLQPDMPGLHLGRLVGLGLLLQVRWPAIPAPLGVRAPELVRGALRCGQREGGAELLRAGRRSGFQLLLLGALVGGEPVRRGVRTGDEDAAAAAALGGFQTEQLGGVPVRGHVQQPMCRRADWLDTLRPSELQPRLSTSGLPVRSLESVVCPELRPAVRAPPRRGAPRILWRRVLRGTLGGDEALPQRLRAARGLPAGRLERLERALRDAGVAARSQQGHSPQRVAWRFWLQRSASGHEVMQDELHSPRL